MQKGPDNSAVPIGNSTTLHCRDSLTNCTNYTISESQVIWSQRVPGSTEDINISEQSKSDRISMNNTCIGQYDLYIQNVTFEDAGSYICLTLQAQYMAELIVLG